LRESGASAISDAIDEITPVACGARDPDG